MEKILVTDGWKPGVARMTVAMFREAIGEDWANTEVPHGDAMMRDLDTPMGPAIAGLCVISIREAVTARLGRENSDRVCQMVDAALKGNN